MLEVCSSAKSKQEAGTTAKALVVFQSCEGFRRHRQQQQGQTRSITHVQRPLCRQEAGASARAVILFPRIVKDESNSCS